VLRRALDSRVQARLVIVDVEADDGYIRTK
jgi:hypothetical protein